MKKTAGDMHAFFLGHIHEIRKDYTNSKQYYQQGLSYAESVGATDMGYYFYSLLHLGLIAKNEGNKQEAKRYFKQVKKVAKRSHSTHARARNELKQL